jgi:uncharacterized protein YlxW (UPF0749 family)
MQKNGSRYIFLFIFIILGIAVAMQFKSTLNARNQNASNTLSTDMLRAQLATEQKETDDLKAATDENLASRENFIKAYIEQNKDYQLANDWNEVKLKAELVDVKGPGLTITLDDAAARQPDTPLKWQIIHDQDIKIILNELKKSGAQAISINGERIVPMSELICAGPTILINGNRYPVPFIINVIGDPDILYDNISQNQLIADMTDYKIRIEITKSKEILIPKFSGAAKLDSFISGLEADKSDKK